MCQEQILVLLLGTPQTDQATQPSSTCRGLVQFHAGPLLLLETDFLTEPGTHRFRGWLVIEPWSSVFTLPFHSSGPPRSMPPHLPSLTWVPGVSTQVLLVVRQSLCILNHIPVQSNCSFKSYGISGFFLKIKCYVKCNGENILLSLR